MKYRLIFLFSAINLFWERVWASFWSLFCAAVIYAALCLLNAPAWLDPRVWVFVQIVFALALIIVTGRYGRGFKMPSVAEVERKMEQAGGLAHRPLSSLHDKVAAGSFSLWGLHQRVAAQAKAQAKPYVARPRVAQQDKYGLRYIALILLLIGAFMARDDAGARLQQGLTPGRTFSLPQQKADMDAWITPPEYTRAPPIFLASARGDAGVAEGIVDVPAGSVLKIRVAGGVFPPRLRFAGKVYGFSHTAERSYFAEFPLEASGRLRVRQGFATLGSWVINATQEAPPEVSIVSVEATPRAALKISYRVKDDNAVVQLTGTVAPPEHPEDASMSTTAARVDTFSMTLPAAGKDDASFTIDLSSHIRAGEEALLSLTAVDAAGHVISTAPFSFTLPERQFNNPLAQKLIQHRKTLITMRDPVSLRVIANDIGATSAQPGLYGGKMIVFMALGSAARRLLYDGDSEAVDSVQDILWDVALKLEDGGLTVAAHDLGDALQKLSQALDDPATPKGELQALLDDARRKMQRYVQALTRQMAQRQAANGKTPPDIAREIMKRIDLGQFMKEMRELAEKDPRAALRKMTEMLKNAADNLDPEKMQEMQERTAKAMQAMQDLRDIITEQQALMDKTSRLDPQSKGAEEAERQDGLRKKLGDAARRLGESMPELPPNLGTADQAMKQALQAFGKGMPKDSLPHQKDALDALQKSLDGAMQKMAEGLQKTMLSLGLIPEGTGQGSGASADPLGRDQEANGGQGGDMTLPSEKERRRVQEIIKELRARSNNSQRPKVERDYLERLLDQGN